MEGRKVGAEDANLFKRLDVISENSQSATIVVEPSNHVPGIHHGSCYLLAIPCVYI